MTDKFPPMLALLALSGWLLAACGGSDPASDTGSNWQDELFVSAQGVSVFFDSLDYVKAGEEHRLHPVPEKPHTWRMQAPPSVNGQLGFEIYFRNETDTRVDVLSVRSEGSFEARSPVWSRKDIAPGDNFTIAFHQTGLDPTTSRFVVETTAGSFGVEVEMGEVLEPLLKCEPSRIPLEVLRSNSTPFSCSNPLPTTFATSIRYAADSTFGFITPRPGSDVIWPLGRTRSPEFSMFPTVIDEGAGFFVHFMFDETTVATVEFY